MKSVVRSFLCLGIAGTALFASAAVAQTTNPQPPPLEAYGKLPDIEDVSLSPKGRIAILGKVNGKRMVLMMDENRKPLNYALVGDIKVRSITWAGEDMVVVQRTDTQELGFHYLSDKAEFSNSMLVPVDPSKEVETVFANQTAIMNATFGSYGERLIDGRWYGFYAGLPMKRNQGGSYFYEGEPSALYRVDLETNKPKRIASGASNNGRRDWEVQADGSIGAYIDVFSASDSWTIYNERGNELVSGTTSPKGWVNLVGFTRDGTGVVYVVGNDENELEWYSAPLAGGPTSRPFADVDGVVDTVFPDRYSRRMIGYALESSPEEPVFFDDDWQTKARMIMKGFDDQNGDIEGWTPDLSKVLVTTGGNLDSGTWFLIETAAMSSQVIGRERPEIGAYLVGPVSTFTYSAGDGLEIESILTLPPQREAKNLPLVMLPHGGPRAHDEEGFDWWAQAFAARGYAVLQPNFRGSTNLNFEFVKKGNGEWGRKMQSDLSDGIAALAAEGVVDPSRACIVGASYGGYAALAGVTLQQGVYQCAVSVAGVSDLKRMVNKEYQQGRGMDLRDFREETIGPRDQMDSISPAQHADKANAPVLLIHGRDDTVVPYEQSTIMEDRLKDAGKPVTLVDLEGEDHWLSRAETRFAMLKAAVEFVEKYNPAD